MGHHSVEATCISVVGCSSSGVHVNTAMLLVLVVDMPCWVCHTTLVLLAWLAGDSTVQSINSCLALHHLATYAHAVVLVDNQTLLDKLGQRQVPSRTASTSASGGNSRTAQLGRSSQGSATAINASGACVVSIIAAVWLRLHLFCRPTSTDLLKLRVQSTCNVMAYYAMTLHVVVAALLPQVRHTNLCSTCI